MPSLTVRQGRARRHKRVRGKIHGTAQRPRLVVDELRLDAAVGAEDDEARPLAGAVHLRAHAAVTP